MVRVVLAEVYVLVGGYSTSPRNVNRVNGNHLGICLSSPSEKWELTYLGPGGLDSVFYLPLHCIEFRPNLELASGNYES